MLEISTRLTKACRLSDMSGMIYILILQLEKERYRGLTYILVGEEKHVGMQDPARGASKIRLGHSVKVYLTEEGYPWMEGQGWICVDSCRS